MKKQYLVGGLFLAGLVAFTPQEVWARGRGGAQRSSQATRSGPQGRTTQVERKSQLQRTGKNTYDRQVEHTTTGPNGQQRSWQAEGSGTIQKTENGHQKTYQGSVTNDKGNSVDVQRTSEVQKNPEGGVTRETNSTYTNQNGKTMEVDRNATSTKNADGTTTVERDVTRTNGQGEVMGTGQSTTTLTPGQGSETTGSYSNSQGKTWQYEGESQKTGPGTVEHQHTTTTPAGSTRSTQSTARWQYIDGRWVKMVESQTTASPSPSP